MGTGIKWATKTFTFAVKWLIGDLTKKWRWPLLLVTVPMFAWVCTSIIPLAFFAGMLLGKSGD